ncbi:hypothetical protein F5Y17DRAFT_462340 [Xylariaceae sp. FL0594]|nr:hypothetical protein F5Y17DRAFT_462340 [Xylariaceae sp. FL0594]
MHVSTLSVSILSTLALLATAIPATFYLTTMNDTLDHALLHHASSAAPTIECFHFADQYMHVNYTICQWVRNHRFPITSRPSLRINSLEMLERNFVLTAFDYFFYFLVFVIALFHLVIIIGWVYFGE